MAIRIFVIDDEKTIADTLAVILTNSGYEASAFYDAGSALEKAASCSPELVITDVLMPGMNGIELAILLRERHPSCKILLLSGMGTTLNIRDMVGSRGYDFELLAKPIYPTDLLAKVEASVIDLKQN